MKYLKYILGLVVVAGLVGVGSWLGTGGTGESETGLAVAALCAPHHVDETVCTRCNPDLIPTFEASGDWCAGHGVPESQCAACHADVAAAGVAPPGVDFTDEHIGHDHEEGEGHSAIESTDVVQRAGEFYPGLSIVFRDNEAGCATEEAIITFASAQTAERAGIQAKPVLTASVHDHFDSPAEVVYDQNETHVLSSSLSISIVRWLTEPGTAVAKGDVLARVESPDMAVLQGDYLESLSDWQVHKREQDRAADMVAKGLIDSASYERTRADATGARARWVQSESRLSLAGLADTDIAVMRKDGSVNSQFLLRAPTGGVLLERMASLGRMQESGEPLARIGNPDALWIEGQVRETDAARIQVGQQVEFTSDGRSLGRTSGEIIWISSFLNVESRTATVRVRPTLTGSLRAHQFGRLHLPEGPTEASIMVPRDAVQWEGCCNVVFVQEAADRYRPQKVEIATGDGEHYRVVSGLTAGDRVVVDGSFLLKTELKKGSIGAGCCGLEAST
jgi:cobalt-zinc-cadmium efflux system membrane fusion protein